MISLRPTAAVSCMFTVAVTFVAVPAAHASPPVVSESDAVLATPPTAPVSLPQTDEATPDGGVLVRLSDALLTPDGGLFSTPHHDVGGPWVWMEKAPTTRGVQFERVHTLHTTTAEDPQMGQQWGLGDRSEFGVHAPDAWPSSTGRSVTVAVIDSGIDVTHPDLIDRIWTNPSEVCGNGVDDDHNGYVDDCHGWNFIASSPEVYVSPFEDLHGTHVAGIIGASLNGQGGAGVAPDVTIMPVKFIAGDSGNTADAVSAITYAVNSGADVLNMSWGSSDPSPAVAERIRWAISRGVSVVVAAGNNGESLDSAPFYPASYQIPGMVVVGASDAAGNPASFSNWSKSRVDVFAPGVGIYSTMPFGFYGYMSGTSMAAPFVSGTAALLYAYGVTAPRTVEDRLRATVTPSRALVGAAAAPGAVNASGALTGTVQALLTVSASERAVRVGDTVTFSASMDPASALSRVSWDVNGSPYGSGASVTVTARTPGLLTATAKVDGRSSSATAAVSDVPGDFPDDPAPFTMGVLPTDVATAALSEPALCGSPDHTLFFSLDDLSAGVADVSVSADSQVTVAVLVPSSDGWDQVSCRSSLTKAQVQIDLASGSGWLLAVGTVDPVPSTLHLGRSASQILGPSEATEGDEVTFSSTPGHPGARLDVLQDSTLLKSAVGSVTVAFPDDGVFSVVLSDGSSVVDEMTVTVLNAAPKIGDVTVSTTDPATLSVEVADVPADMVSVSVAFSDGTGSDLSLHKAPVHTPATVIFDVPPAASGWVQVTAADEDGGTVSTLVSLPADLGFVGVPVLDLPVLGTAAADVQLDATPELEHVVVQPSGLSGVNIWVDDVRVYENQDAPFSALFVRAIASSPSHDLWVLSADVPGVVSVWKFPRTGVDMGAGMFDDPVRVGAVAASALDVVNIEFTPDPSVRLIDGSLVPIRTDL